MAATQAVRPTGWQRSANNPILSPAVTWEGLAVEEPTVLIDAVGGKFRMYYDGTTNLDNTGAWGMGVATCPLTSDPAAPGNWTKYASNPVLGQGGSSYAGKVSGTNVVLVGSTYYCYFFDGSGASPLYVSTSSDGYVWGTPTVAIAAAAVAWMRGWANSFVWNEGGSTWKMLVEGRNAANTAWVTNYATSTDGLSWTVQGSGPLTSLAVGTNYGGPWLANGGAKTNGRYHLWFHSGTGALFSDIFHAYSTDAQNWTVTATVELQHNWSANEKEQVADPCIVEHGGVSYLFYSGVDNTGAHAYTLVATYPGAIASKVLWET